MNQSIKVRGARVHNLKNIDVDIPINSISCVMGPSGSGKSSLAFHTIYSESKRRYLNSMPDSFRFFSDRPLKADVDEISPVLPVFALAQSNPVMNSRSTVVDVMGISEKLQKVFYSLGEPTCPNHGTPFEESQVSNSIKRLLEKDIKNENQVVHILIDKETYLSIFSEGEMPARSFNQESIEIQLFEREDSHYEILRFKWKGLEAINKKLSEQANLKEGMSLDLYTEGLKKLKSVKWTKKKSCSSCTETTPDFKLEFFSSYNALGACRECSGHGAVLVFNDEKIFHDLNKPIDEGGIEIFRYKRLAKYKPLLYKDLKKLKVIDRPLKKYPKKVWDIFESGGENFPGFVKIFKYLETKKYKKDVRILLRNLQKEQTCSLCSGTRVNQIAGNTIIQDVYFSDMLKKNLDQLSQALIDLVNKNNNFDSYTKNLMKSILGSLKVAVSIGLGNLYLLDKTKRLSAGVYQRLLMVKYLAYEGSGSLFIFDEPSLGLSLREQKKLFQGIVKLKEQGNTVLIVEHSDFFHSSCDHLIKMGEGAGHLGGEVLFEGNPSKKIDKYKKIKFEKRKPISWIKVNNLSIDNWDKKSFKIPIDCITQIDGESNSGKSEYFFEAFPKVLIDKIENRLSLKSRIEVESISLDSEITSVFAISASMGKVTSRSTIGSFLGLAPEVRKHFAGLYVSRALGLEKGHFSSNSDLGRCSKCEGSGKLIIDMVYLEDIELECEQCSGRGLKKQYADIFDGKMTAWETYSRPISKVLPNIKLTPKFMRIWEYLQLLNLDYLSLNRKLNSLSGGERQRVNLVSLITQNPKDHMLIFENISFGLSDKELVSLARLLKRLSSQSNTILIIDNHRIFNDLSDYQIALG